MATLDELLSSCQNRLAPNVDYASKLRGARYETIQQIAQEKIDRFIQTCDLVIEDAVTIWAAAMTSRKAAIALEVQAPLSDATILYAQRLLSLKGFVRNGSSLSKGISSRLVFYYITRKVMVPSILRLVLTRNVVVMKAPLATGKTSTAQLVAWGAEVAGHNVIFVNCAGVSGKESVKNIWTKASGGSGGSSGRSLTSILRSPYTETPTRMTSIIFDEAQAMYSVPGGSAWVWGLVKERMGDASLGPARTKSAWIA